MPTTAITPEFKQFLDESTLEELMVLSQFTSKLQRAEVRALSRRIQKKQNASRVSLLKTLPDESNHEGIAIMLRHSVEFHLEQKAAKKGAGDVEG